MRAPEDAWSGDAGFAVTTVTISACSAFTESVAVEEDQEGQADALLYATGTEAMESFSKSVDEEVPLHSALREGWDEAGEAFADEAFATGHSPKAWLQRVWARLDEESHDDNVATPPPPRRRLQRPATAEILRRLGLVAPDSQPSAAATGVEPHCGVRGVGRAPSPPSQARTDSAADPLAPLSPAVDGPSQCGSRPATVPGLDMDRVHMESEFHNLGAPGRPTAPGLPGAADGSRGNVELHVGASTASSASRLLEEPGAAEDARLPAVPPERGGAVGSAVRRDFRRGLAGMPQEATAMERPLSRPGGLRPLPRSRSAPGGPRGSQGSRGPLRQERKQPARPMEAPEAQGVRGGAWWRDGSLQYASKHGEDSRSSPYWRGPSTKARPMASRGQPCGVRGRHAQTVAPLGTAHVHHHQHLHYHVLMGPEGAADVPVPSPEAVCLGGVGAWVAGTH
ncbi:unnamed protein product [Prorocentrum cordatum]|uniref:Uncharacterized protein n=1 Tax=Prorocentrum cordatum TaxID=2364126 RepID=A0ABN9T6Y7_9DINO|nr:unnamed protein product [Polarella glacialis]